MVLNLTMIELVDLSFYGRELVGDFGRKQNELSRCNINVIIINFLGTWKVHR